MESRSSSKKEADPFVKFHFLDNERDKDKLLKFPVTNSDNTENYFSSGMLNSNFNQLRNNVNQGHSKINTINSSILFKDMYTSNSKYISNSNIAQNNKSSSQNHFKKYSKLIKSKGIQESFDLDSNLPGTNFKQTKITNSSNKKTSSGSLFNNYNENKLILTKTLKNNKYLSDNLTKLSHILKNESSTINSIINPNSKIYCYDKNFLLGNSKNNQIPINPSGNKTESTSGNNKKAFFNFSSENVKFNTARDSFTLTTPKLFPKFKDQVAMNDYLIRNFNVGSQNVKNISSKQKIKLITNFYKTQKEEKLRKNSLLKRSTFSKSSGNIPNNSKENHVIFGEENSQARRIHNINVVRSSLSKTVNFTNKDDRFKVSFAQQNTESSVSSSPKEFFKLSFLKPKNESDTYANSKHNPKNVFRMRASHIMTLNNDLINDDKLNTLNYIKVPHVKNKKLKDFLHKIKKSPADINPKLNNLTEANFMENFNKYKHDLDNQIIDTILAQKKMPTQSYLKMKFRKSTIEKFKQFEPKLDPCKVKLN